MTYKSCFLFLSFSFFTLDFVFPKREVRLSKMRREVHCVDEKEKLTRSGLLRESESERQFEATLPSTDQRFFFIFSMKKKLLVWRNVGVWLPDEVTYRWQATSQMVKYAARAADWVSTFSSPLVPAALDRPHTDNKVKLKVERSSLLYMVSCR